MIEITSTPEHWRAGDYFTGAYGNHIFSGFLWESRSSSEAIGELLLAVGPVTVHPENRTNIRIISVVRAGEV